MRKKREQNRDGERASGAGRSVERETTRRTESDQKKKGVPPVGWWVGDRLRGGRYRKFLAFRSRVSVATNFENGQVREGSVDALGGGGRSQGSGGD